jgi:hypothetical protein
MGDQKFTYGRHVKPLVPAVFAVVSTHQSALARVVGYGLFSLWVIHKEGLCPNSGNINRLMMMMMKIHSCCKMYHFDGPAIYIIMNLLKQVLPLKYKNRTDRQTELVYFMVSFISKIAESERAIK